jgi:hypothetical protein
LGSVERVIAGIERARRPMGEEAMARVISVVTYEMGASLTIILRGGAPGTWS